MSHPHDPNRWPEAADHDPRQSVPNEPVWPSKAWHETGGKPAKRGKMPWWAWLLIGFGGFLVLVLVLVLALGLWASVAINGQATGGTQSEPAPTAVAEPTSEPEPSPTESENTSATELYREMNADFPADQEAYLNELVDNARPVYVGSDNRVLLAMGLAVCLKLDSGETIEQVALRIPDQYTNTQAGTIIGASVRHLCPANQPAIDEFLTTL